MKRAIRGSITHGLIGVWWLYNDKLIYDAVPLDDGFSNGEYLQYSETKNHASEWRRLVKKFIEDDPENLISQGYKSIERGRVIFNLRTQSYEVTCSEAFWRDLEGRDIVIDAFDLKGCRFDFVKLSHYYVYKLTGNPNLDRYEYDVF